MTTILVLYKQGGFVPIKKTASEYCGPCPSCGGTDRFILLPGEDRAFCRTCGWKGDSIQYLRDFRNMTYAGALSFLDRESGSWNGPRPKAETARPEGNSDKAAYLWGLSKPAAGTPVEAYLKSRGLSGQIPPSIRYLPGNDKHLPAMIARITYEGDSEKINVHLTRFDPTVDHKKIRIGTGTGGAVRLAPAGEILCVCEGVETGLSVMEATGLPTWCVLSASNYKGLALPQSARTVIICADNDPAGLRAAREAASVWTRQGRTVRIAIPPVEGWDFNDLLRAEGPEAVRQIVEAAEAFKPEHEATVEEPGCDPIIKPWPELDKAALRGIAGEFVELATRSSEADPAAILASFLVRFGIEAGPKSYQWVGDARHEARINAVIVGETSKSRKGTSLKPVQRLFELSKHTCIGDLGLYTGASTSPGPLSSGEGLIYAVRDEVKTWKIDKNGEGQYVTLDPGVDDKRLFVGDEEFATALSCIQRQGNTLSMVFRTLYDSGDAEPLTKTARTKCTGAHVGIVSHITNRELTMALDENQAMNGFANRFLWVCAKRQGFVPFPEPMPETALRRIQERLLKTIISAQVDQRIQLSDNARAIWIDVYPALSAAKPGLVGSITARSEIMALRLAMIYALLDGTSEIGDEHLDAGVAFWKYCEDSAEYIFGSREIDPKLQELREALAEGPKTSSDLHRRFSNNMDKKTLAAKLGELISRGEARQDKGAASTARGRRKIIYSLNEKNELNEFNREDHRSPGINSFPSFNSYRGFQNFKINECDRGEAGEVSHDEY